jgi:hypothetical protein
MGLLTFPLDILVVVAAYAAVGVFSLAQVEHVWGRWGSFQIMITAGVFVGAFATVPFGVAASVMRRYPSPWLSLALGCGVSVATLSSAWLTSAAGLSPALSAFVLFGGAALAPLACPTKITNRSPTAVAS